MKNNKNVIILVFNYPEDLKKYLIEKKKAKPNQYKLILFHLGFFVTILHEAIHASLRLSKNTQGKYKEILYHKRSSAYEHLLLHKLMRKMLREFEKEIIKASNYTNKKKIPSNFKMPLPNQGKFDYIRTMFKRYDVKILLIAIDMEISEQDRKIKELQKKLNKGNK